MPQNARNTASKKALQKTKGKGGRHQEVLPWWQSTWLLGGVVVVVIAVVLVFVIGQKTQQPQETGIGAKPVPAGVQAIILHPDVKVLDAVGLGSIKPSQAQVYKVPASAKEPFLRSNGKPEFFYLVPVLTFDRDKGDVLACVAAPIEREGVRVGVDVSRG